MNNNYHRLYNFVHKISKPKLKEAALETHMNLDEKKGDDAVEIFENGIDNAEAVYAVEARKILKALEPDEPEKTTTVGFFDIETGGLDNKSAILTPTVEFTPILPLKEVENRHIQEVLLKMNNNRTHAAQALGISLKTLYNKMESGEIKG